MRKALYVFVLLSLTLSILVACGSNETVKKEANQGDSVDKETNVDEKEKEEKEVEEEEFEIATTIEEIIKEKPGKYSGNKYNQAIVHRDLDENSFQDKDSFQVYQYLLGLMSESETFEEHYEFAESFNANIETTVSGTPEGMKLDDGQVVNGVSNIAILLDASGSMAQKIGGKTKMELAKEAINNFVASMPEGANVSLRVYGHKGSNSDSDKELSCASTELVYELNAYNEADFKASLDSFRPTGWTPIANAIMESKKDFEKAANDAQNIIYVVSDGIETCDGDPVKAAKELHDSNIKAVVNIIGFDVDSNGQKQLLEVAEAGGGQYETVNSADDFKKVWEKERVRLYNEWSKWSSENYNKVSREQTEKVNELYKKKSEFSNLMYAEKNHLSEAAYYLYNQEQISSDVRKEVESLISQRKNILDDYEGRFKEQIDHLQDQGKSMKDEILEQGDNMKDKYRN
ncbi:VWA domain-containing protein [Metabacillus malikii]|uniref:VWFA domain-containing protein n=1 Tax=Metabacillus malikii TaxID=1504265 RepID=A0ABT9ZI10_9BACI|nr:VWA domain-containing protein [Metabacillus malikii]MDQ0230840.1 hypothetical protein [Metabacillus malikii]